MRQVRFKMHVGWLSACAVLLGITPVHAADPGVVVTGTRLSQTPAGLAQNVTVIAQQDIEAMHPARIEDLLARVTGAYVDAAGATGGFASLYLRGAENSHLLVLLDGVKLNDPTTTRGSAYDLSSLDVSRIERIELLRGPASAIYGGEALAGVLHIITRPAGTRTGLSGTGHLALGGDRYRNLGGSLAFGQDNLRLQLSAGHGEDGSRRDAWLELDTFSGSVRYQTEGGIEAELTATQIQRDSEAFPDDSGGPRLAVNRTKTTRASKDHIYGLRIAFGDASRLHWRAGLSRLDRREQGDNAFIDGGVRFPVPAFSSDTDFRRDDLYVSATREFGTAASVIAGFEHQREEGDLASIGDFFGIGSPQTLRFDLKRSTNAGFIEGRVRLSQWLTAQLGLRHDKVEGLDAETTPHLGLVWELPNETTTLKLNANQGFKPPSFFALGFPIGANPQLKPERSRNLEATLVQRLGATGSMLRVSVFKTRYQDLVDFDGATFTNVNRGRIEVRGIEPELQLRLGDRWRIQAGATLLDIDERDGLQPLRNRPGTRLTGGVILDLTHATVFAGVRGTGHFLDRSNPTGDIRMAGYTVVDAACSFRLGVLTLNLALDNVLDREYEQFVGFPAQGRRLRAELRGSF
ncbi:MAG TPA: TonB-dependent receptor [Steroidobacteraceae bacterium]|nr:TonB-dependent receptor [Steroidobacteraceae bacterium]HQX78705.1 TonB-dependent receptor [Steroidobacteraceae bacterium]HQZ79226.1 TonB-dependent receptor [Steroidobacteraceae bacterium]